MTPRSHGYGTPLRRIYAGQKYPHVYTLSFSTGKNQRRKHSGNIHSNRIVQVHDYHRKCGAPILAGTETPLRRTYAGRWNHPVCTLSINTGKNQRRKHSGNIHSNRKVQVHGYHRKLQYYRNITSLENTRVHNAKRYKKAERCSRAARGTSRAKQEKSYDGVQASAAL